MTRFAIERRCISKLFRKPRWLTHMSRMVRPLCGLRHFMNQRGLDSVFSLSALEAKLVAYVRDADAASQPFDVSSVPKVSREQAAQEVVRKCGTSLSVQPLIVAQGRARWIPLASLSQERRLQCRHPKQRSRHNRHTYNSWPKYQN